MSTDEGDVITVRATAYPEPNSRLPEQLPYYIVNFPLKDVGEYEGKTLFHMNMDSQLGKTGLQLPIDIKKPEGVIGMEMIGFAVIFLGGSVWLLFTRIKRSRKIIKEVMYEI